MHFSFLRFLAQQIYSRFGQSFKIKQLSLTVLPLSMCCVRHSTTFKSDVSLASVKLTEFQPFLSSCYAHFELDCNVSRGLWVWA